MSGYEALLDAVLRELLRLWGGGSLHGHIWPSRGGSDRPAFGNCFYFFELLASPLRLLPPSYGAGRTRAATWRYIMLGRAPCSPHRSSPSRIPRTLTPAHLYRADYCHHHVLIHRDPINLLAYRFRHRTLRPGCQGARQPSVKEGCRQRQREYIRPVRSLLLSTATFSSLLPLSGSNTPRSARRSSAGLPRPPKLHPLSSTAHNALRCTMGMPQFPA